MQTYFGSDLKRIHRRIATEDSVRLATKVGLRLLEVFGIFLGIWAWTSIDSWSPMVTRYLLWMAHTF